MIHTNFRIRPFRLSDLAPVLTVERASFTRDAYPGELFLEYHEKGALFLVAEQGGPIAGYSLAVVSGERGELVSIAVLPGFRHAGVGRMLLASTLRRLRRRGARRTRLMVKTTNLAAQRFYESFGFRLVRRVRAYYEDGRDGYLMALDA